jgi:hypothetical protein
MHHPQALVYPLYGILSPLFSSPVSLGPRFSLLSSHLLPPTPQALSLSPPSVPSLILVVAATSNVLARMGPASSILKKMKQHSAVLVHSIFPEFLKILLFHFDFLTESESRKFLSINFAFFFVLKIPEC